MKKEEEEREAEWAEKYRDRVDELMCTYICVYVYACALYKSV